MARKHGVLKVEIWEPGSDFRLLKRAAQRAYLLLLSQPTINNCGVLAYTPERWAMYAVDDTVRGLERAFRELSVAGFVVLDARTREILVRTFIKHDQISEQPNLVKSAKKQFREVESLTIKRTLSALYPWVSEGWSEPLPEVLLEDLGSGVRSPLSHVRAPVTPTPTPTPTPEREGVNGSSEAKGLGRSSTPGSNPEKERAIDRLSDLKRADAQTGNVIRSLYGDLPPAAFVSAREAALEHGGDIGYAIGTLRSMKAEGQYS